MIKVAHIIICLCRFYKVVHFFSGITFKMYSQNSGQMKSYVAARGNLATKLNAGERKEVLLTEYSGPDQISYITYSLADL